MFFWYRSSENKISVLRGINFGHQRLRCPLHHHPASRTVTRHIFRLLRVYKMLLQSFPCLRKHLEPCLRLKGNRRKGDHSESAKKVAPDSQVTPPQKQTTKGRATTSKVIIYILLNIFRILLFMTRCVFKLNISKNKQSTF